MPERLSQDAVSTALEALPGWSGDTDRLSRTVQVPADSQDALLESVRQLADTLDHHPDVAREGDHVTFTLVTHSSGGVTEKDVDLATRIDQVLSGTSATGD